MKILGIDPGTTNAAAAVVERNAHGWRLVESPVITSLDALLNYLVAIGRDDIHCVCVEDLTWIGAKGATATDGFGSAQIVRAVGAAQLFAKERRIPFIEVRPASWRKRVAGNGKATKEQVREMVRRMVRGVPKVFGLNRSDAVAIALAGAMEPGSRL